MKFKEDRPFANPEAAMAKLLEIADGIDSASGLLGIHFFQEGCNSQLIRVAFTLRRRSEDTRGQLHLHGRCSCDLRQDDYRLIQYGPHHLDFVGLKYHFSFPPTP
jgi:hypothetical protein